MADCDDVTNDLGRDTANPCGMFDALCAFEDYKSWYRLGQQMLAKQSEASEYLKTLELDAEGERDALVNKLFTFRKQFLQDHRDPDNISVFDAEFLTPKESVMKLKTAVASANCLLEEVNEYISKAGKDKVFEVTEEEVNAAAAEDDKLSPWAWAAIVGGGVLGVAGVVTVVWFATKR